MAKEQFIQLTFGIDAVINSFRVNLTPRRETRVPVETRNYSAAPFESVYMGHCTQIAYRVSPEVQAENGFTNPDVFILIKTPIDPFLSPATSGMLFDKNHFEGVGDVNKIPLRISSACLPGSLGDTECSCHVETVDFLKQIKDIGVGVFVYLPQEAQGRGLRDKVRDHRLIYGVDNEGNLIPPVSQEEALRQVHSEGYDIRRYYVLRTIFEELGLSNLKFQNLGNDGLKRLEIVDQTGLNIEKETERRMAN